LSVTRILNSTVHGVLDYGLALAFLLLPGLLDFPGFAASLSYIIGVVYLGASLITRYPLGALKLIPFPVHGVLEAIMAASWIAMPWLFEFARHAAARNFFVIAGLGLLLVAACTDYQSTGSRIFKGEERRHRMVDRRQRALGVRQDRRAGAFDRRGHGYAAA
jgi:hypothetical protein